jgi:hypothetical protein
VIYNASAKGPFRVSGVHDRDSKRNIGIIYRPNEWASSTVYYLRGTDDYDVVIPTTFNGYYYKVVSPGVSGATEPTWGTKIGGKTTSGSVIFEAVAYNLMPASESITASSWTASDSVTISNESLTTTYTICRIDAVPDAVESFTLTNHTTRSNGEEHDVTLQFKVGIR